MRSCDGSIAGSLRTQGFPMMCAAPMTDRVSMAGGVASPASASPTSPGCSPARYATMMLADFGADVIKIESPDGDDTRRWMPPVDAGGGSTYFGSVNRNKRSVVLRPARPKPGSRRRGGSRESADVVIENFRPGVMARLGLDFDTIRAANPGVVYCSITGFGTRRRRRARRLRPARAGGRRADEHHRRAGRRSRARSASHSSTCSPG